jgi:predicted aconitase with swiveling domain
MKKIRGRVIARGVGRGKVLLSPDDVSFLGGVDAETGVVVEPGHALEGRCVAGRVLVFPRGKGSTVGSYVLYGLARRGLAPAAIVNVEAEIIVAVGAILAEVPMLDRLEADPYEVLRDGDEVVVDGNEGVLCLVTPAVTH